MDILEQLTSKLKILSEKFSSLKQENKMLKEELSNIKNQNDDFLKGAENMLTDIAKTLERDKSK